MPIVAGDIKFKLSTRGGSAGNQAAGFPSLSLGKYISTSEITSAELNNLFDDISGEENAALDVQYRCIFIHNAHGSLDLGNVRLWISAEASGGADIAIAITEIGGPPSWTSPINQAAAQAEEIANGSTAPVGLSFFYPDSQVTGQEIADPSTLESGHCVAFWIRRTAADTAAMTNDSFTLMIEGDTAA